MTFVAELIVQFVGELLIDGAWHGSRKLWRELTGKDPILERALRNTKTRTPT
jgi:hypothetical protein